MLLKIFLNGRGFSSVTQPSCTIGFVDTSPLTRTGNHPTSHKVMVVYLFFGGWLKHFSQ
jgi:hypothetical protein